jgi:cytochrome-b5 reductase
MYIGTVKKEQKQPIISSSITSYRVENPEISPVDKHIKEIVYSKDGFLPHKLLKIHALSSNTSVFTFENTSFSFEPGQHVQVRIIDNFEPVIRKYTPIACTKDSFDLLIKKYDKGVMSRHIHSLKIGDTLEIDGPCGRILHHTDFEKKKIVLIAGGTGLTPMIPILRSNHFKHHKKALLFATQRENLYLHEELKGLTESGLYLTILLNERDRIKSTEQHITYGRVDEDIFMKGVDLGTESCKFLICGPDAFISSIQTILKGLNYKEKDIHIF